MKPENFDNLYYRNYNFYVLRKLYGTSIMIMGGGALYVSDAYSNIIRILIKQKELKNFIKIDENNINKFSTKEFNTYRSFRDVDYEESDWIIDTFRIVESTFRGLKKINHDIYITNEEMENQIDYIVKHKYQSLLRKDKLIYLKEKLKND